MIHVYIMYKAFAPYMLVAQIPSLPTRLQWLKCLQGKPAKTCKNYKNHMCFFKAVSIPTDLALDKTMGRSRRGDFHGRGPGAGNRDPEE